MPSYQGEEEEAVCRKCGTVGHCETHGVTVNSFDKLTLSLCLYFHRIRS